MNAVTSLSEIQRPTFTVSELDAIRAEFYNHAEYICLRDFGISREHWPEIEAHAGVLTGIRAGRGVDRAYLDPEGEFHLGCEAFEEDGHTVADLVLWRPELPGDFATVIGAAVGLGLSQVRNPATYAYGWPLLVHRTPLKWLQAGCRGVVVLDRDSAPGWLAEAPGQIAAEDIEHGRELARMLHGYFDPEKIVRPAVTGSAA
ncbi:hypothetical protein [Methylobacterium iners]|uniref:Uncharacterized protein n=1 Tax=Methylobacterium iners TaxID=418707 RepID=A0ABQ4RVH6_9HYPH|nr:hypothetical protein [Methylobacterium iners]GJD94153.1 hypothetical protein OCOJLMKI_1355 [Methylobacterium iners]